MPQLSINQQANGFVLQIKVLEIIGNTVRVRNEEANISCILPLAAFPWLTPGDEVVINLAIFRVATTEIPDQPDKPQLILPGKAN